MEEALAAVVRQDLAYASGLWDKALAAGPDLAKSSPQTALVLSLLGRLDEAEAIMAAGLAREPKSLIFGEGYAIVAERRNDLPEAIRRWTAVRSSFPREPAAYMSGSACLRLAGRPEEADAVAQAGRTACAANIGIAIEHARAAEALGNWTAALHRWEIVRDRFQHVFGTFGAAQALAKLGREDEADQVLAYGRYTHPTEPSLAIEAARNAQARNDLPEALRRWADVRRCFPSMPHGYVEGAKAMALAGDITGIEAVRADAARHLPELVLENPVIASP